MCFISEDPNLQYTLQASTFGFPMCWQECPFQIRHWSLYGFRLKTLHIWTTQNLKVQSIKIKVYGLYLFLLWCRTVITGKIFLSTCVPVHLFIKKLHFPATKKVIPNSVYHKNRFQQVTWIVVCRTDITDKCSKTHYQNPCTRKNCNINPHILQKMLTVKTEIFLV